MPAGTIERQTQEVSMSEVVAALSYALDITEGQPEGHAARSCMIGMRLARELRLGVEDRSALFYALLMKDLGCSSNAAKVCYLFQADDRTAKRELKLVDWTRLPEQTRYLLKHVGRTGNPWHRLVHAWNVIRTGKETSRELVKIRCHRGAIISRQLGFPEATADAIQGLDEHWDGRGQPEGLRHGEIPLLARILGLSQTVEVFFSGRGLDAAVGIAEQRSGTWFDPKLVQVLRGVRRDHAFWESLKRADVGRAVPAYEPVETAQVADDARLDDIAAGFGQVIDAKSPWTFRHSEGVAEVAVGIGKVMGFSTRELIDLKRAALLHDIGKLGVSNLILDKPGKLTPEETTVVRRHPLYTCRILERVAGFRDIANMAAGHHERLDGKGYHRGLAGEDVSRGMRVLAVADMYEALAAKRPYREDLKEEQVMVILEKAAGTGLCPATLEALKVFLSKSGFVPVKLAA